MRFEKVLEIPFGSPVENKRAYKVYFVNYDNNLFLQGYKILNEINGAYDVYVLRRLNELYDDGAIDLNSDTDVAKLNGPTKVEIANDTVKGFAKILEVEVDYTQSAPLPQTSGEDEQISVLKKYQPAVADYLSLLFFILKKKYEKTDPGKPDSEIREEAIFEMYMSKDLDRLLYSDFERAMLESIFPIRRPLKIEYLNQFFKLIYLIRKNKIPTQRLDKEDIVYGMKYVNELDEFSLINELKQMQTPKKKTASFDFALDSTTIYKQLKIFLSSFAKATSITFYMNGKLIKEKGEIRIYKQDMLHNLNNGIISFNFEDGYLFVFVKEKVIQYSVDDKGYVSPRNIDDNFEFESLENSILTIELENKGV